MGALRLSKRESEMAQMIVRDLTEVQIASLLGISHHTVHTHIEHIFRKSGTNSRTQFCGSAVYPPSLARFEAPSAVRRIVDPPLVRGLAQLQRPLSFRYSLSHRK
ncbi:MAG: helix-turn-helix domain-containing protein [Gammaproteobacteria bacterium]